KRCWNSALDEEMATDPNVFVMGDQVQEYPGCIQGWRIQGCIQDNQGIIGQAGFAGIIVGSTYHGLKSMIEFMTFNFSMHVRTIWDKGLEREQNVGVPIYGERSDLLISERKRPGKRGAALNEYHINAVEHASINGSIESYDQSKEKQAIDIPLQRDRIQKNLLERVSRAVLAFSLPESPQAGQLENRTHRFFTVDTSVDHIESRTSYPIELVLMLAQEGFPSSCEYIKSFTLMLLAIITRIMRRT
ncbi:pyruvate dehydrogenase E1 component subunit beta-1, mitochondrial isoform X1, partial [Tanacetum coccineum]